MGDVSRTERGVARRAALVTAGTLGSRVLGMLRDVVVAASFQVGATDAFFVAFTVPNTVRMLLGEGAVQNAFVPVFAEVKDREGAEGARDFLARFGGTLALLLAAACVLGMLGAPWLSRLYAAGYHDNPDQLIRVTSLTRALFPFLFAAGLAALATGALNSLGRFGLPALTPALVNVAMIAAVLTLTGPLNRAGQEPLYALVVGALVGGGLQVLVNAMALSRTGMLSRPRLGLRDPRVRRSLSLMLPLVAGLGIYQINILLSRMLASFLPAGSQSYLSYGQRVVEIPQGMFALAVASATLPTLSALRSAGEQDELMRLFRFSLRMTAFVAIPASVGLWATREATLATLFGRGAFGPEHVTQAAWSLGYQALGVCALAGVRTVVPMFAAHQQTRAPVVCSGLNLLVFLSLALTLMGPMRHAGLALANSAGAAVQLLALLWWLRRYIGPLGLDQVAKSAARTLLSACLMGACVRGLDNWLQVAAISEEIPRIASYLGLLATGAAVFVGASGLLRSPELRELHAVLKRRRAA